jgi:hypothetical protein
MNEVKLAYLAGAIDADGFFMISRNRVKNTVSFSEHIGLGQVHKTVPALLLNTFGGFIYTRSWKGKNWRQMHYWRISATAAATTAKMLLPFLRLKTRQAQILCELQELKRLPWHQRRTVKVGLRAYKNSPEIIERQLAFFTEMKALNRTGIR